MRNMVKDNLLKKEFIYRSKNYLTNYSNARQHNFIITISFMFSRLPYWIQSFIPKILYVTEKAWNYYPYTLTGKLIKI